MQKYVLNNDNYVVVLESHLTEVFSASLSFRPRECWADFGPRARLEKLCYTVCARFR